MVELERQKELEIKYVDVETSYKSWPLIPDLLYIIKMTSRGYIFIIEVDRSEKKEKDELEKIQGYRDWQLSNQWLREPWATVMPSQRFPRIIYAFDESKPRWQSRAKRFQQKADGVGLRMTTCGLSRIEDTIKALAINA
jgi:16S rRNA C967 or C1407 C5-methylase (RsmB/RsmF family)